jgi:hypothetical protein
LAGRTAVPSCDSRQADGRIIAQRRDGFQAHLACALHGPLIILFEQQGTDEPDDGGLVGQCAPGHTSRQRLSHPDVVAMDACF